MRNQLGIKALTLISLCMFAWSGWIYAADPKIEDAWGGQPTGSHEWEVDRATGGHLSVGDKFTIGSTTNDNKNIYLRQLPPLWAPGNTQVPLGRHNSKDNGQPDFLCGFVELDTAEHQADSQNDRKYGHGKWHGFLIKVKNSKELKIIWSAVPLNDTPAPTPTAGRCGQLVDKFHGGMAHAKG